MSKYYTPEIEEFHVGFEYERFVPRSNATEEDCWDKIIMPVNYLTLDEIDDEILEKEIRVKFLDKEDIESLGFKIEDENFLSTLDQKKWIHLQYFQDFKGWYLSVDEEESQFSFSGWIKNKSELKKLLIQLDIE